MSRSPRGRRPGTPDTRRIILDAARVSFAGSGFGGTTIRAIAAEAGVDAALVHHYFGTKDDLFLASLALPVDPREVIAPVVAAGPDGAGERLLWALLGVWDDPDNQPALLALARSVLEPGGRHLIADGFIPVVIGPLLGQLVPDRPEDRVPLVVSQIVGVILTRYVIPVGPLAALPADVLVARVAPTLQRYLTGELA